jgi:hemerythrin-like domain-containing protein
MPAIKPIKRSKQLAPLSREHHDSLLFTWKIKQGLNNKTPVQEISLYIQWYWNNFLQSHFSEEEKLLLPYLPATDDLAIQLKTEHEKIKKLIAGSSNNASLALLADTINDHIRFEERQFFPYLEKKLMEEQLNSIYRQLDEHPLCNEKWDNEFWVKKK